MEQKESIRALNASPAATEKINVIIFQYGYLTFKICLKFYLVKLLL